MEAPFWPDNEKTPPAFIQPEVKITQQPENKKPDLQDKVASYPFKSKTQMRKIQTALKNAGFYKGKIDGKTGPQTKSAIKAFQKSKKLKPDGLVGKKTWVELSKYLKN